MKKLTPPLVIREMQIIIMRFHFIPERIAIIKENQTIINIGKAAGGK